MSDLKEVGRYESKSSAGKFYTVKRHSVTGALACDCPAWRFKKGDQERTCKHVQAAAVGVIPPTPTVEAVEVTTEDVVPGLMADIEATRAAKKPWGGLAQALREVE